MTYRTHVKDVAIAAICVLGLAACDSQMSSLTSPTSVRQPASEAANPDGSTLKVTTPTAAAPLNNASGVSVIPTLVAVPSRGRSVATAFPHRFQVSTTENFAEIARTGIGSFDSQGIVRFVVEEQLSTGVRYYWRVRAELEDQPGPWSSVVSFVTTGTVAAAPRPDVPGENRTPNPPAGQRLPLPDMRGVLNQFFANASDSCPTGRQYVLNPWLNRVIDRFRQTDTRWGYNAKPTRTASQNGGVPVQAAGDEGAYNYGTLSDEGTVEVHLVDMLVSHCGSTPIVGWRVFTGEEPGRWTGAGRF
jgi:hypothetical protein